MSNIRASRVGDLFIAADESYIRQARKLELTAEVLALAQQRPVIAVSRTNPKQIRIVEEQLFTQT